MGGVASLCVNGAVRCPVMGAGGGGFSKGMGVPRVWWALQFRVATCSSLCLSGWEGTLPAPFPPTPQRVAP